MSSVAKSVDASVDESGQEAVDILGLLMPVGLHEAVRLERVHKVPEGAGIATDGLFGLAVDRH